MRIESTILFGKYQLGQVIGRGRDGIVYLAEHKELEEYRAIKRVSKTCVEYEQFRREALLLKELHHPGIPIIYDLEEDLEYSYLIEEYLEGDSLYDLVRNHGPLSQEAAIRYGIQICNLVHYLHSAGDSPILHLDLQPKNLILCHETVKLIDFNHAATILEANTSKQRYGTPGYAAPEQQSGDILSERTDIFSIGCILYYMRMGRSPEEPPDLSDQAVGASWKSLFRTCFKLRSEERFQSAEVLRQALESMNPSESGTFKKNNLSSLTIALLGSKSGVGTTHLSFGLSYFLKQQGYPNLYEEYNDSGAVRQMAQQMGAVEDSYGIFQMKSMRVKPRYGEAVHLKEAPYPLRIQDYGTNWKQVLRQEDVDLILLVRGGKWWDSLAGSQ
ncbi:MAG: serine/threonine-protein kinase, partial [Hungatella sp.]